MPSGVRSAIYTAVPLVSAIVIVLSTNPVVTTCVVGLCTGAAILVSWNASARIISDTLTVTNLSSFSSEAKGAEPSTPAMGVVTPGQWTNYPSTPMTQPELQSNGDIPALSLYDYSMELGKWLDNEPKPPPDRSWVTTTDAEHSLTWGRRSNKKIHTTKHTHEFEYEESTYGDAQPTKFCRCGYVAPYEPVYDPYTT